MKAAKDERAVIQTTSKVDARIEHESKRVAIAISGPGIVTVRSTNLVKSDEARRQISALKRLKGLGVLSH